MLVAAWLMKSRPVIRLGGYHGLRIAHAGLGICCLLVLFAHTGFGLGANLNAVLMGCYLVVPLCGALSGVSIGRSTFLRSIGIVPANRFRQAVMKLHVVLLHPLPALVIIHVLIVYLY